MKRSRNKLYFTILVEDTDNGPEYVEDFRSNIGLNAPNLGQYKLKFQKNPGNKFCEKVMQGFLTQTGPK